MLSLAKLVRRGRLSLLRSGPTDRTVHTQAAALRSKASVYSVKPAYTTE